MYVDPLYSRPSAPEPRYFVISNGAYFDANGNTHRNGNDSGAYSWREACAIADKYAPGASLLRAT